MRIHHPEAPLSGEDRIKCHNCAMGFTRVSVGANLAMAGIKLAVGFLTGSRALIAASLYSINDAFSAIIAMVSLKLGRRPANETFAYGHGKVEFVAVAGMSFLLAAGVFLVMYESVGDLAKGVKGPPHVIAAGVAILAAMGNWLLAQRGFCGAKYLQSPTLHTSAEHNEADALSSLAVLVGVAGGAVGFHSLDRYIAIFETIHVLALSGALLGRSINGLMDHALSEPDTLKLRAACERTAGVIQVTGLKSRMVGGYTWVDVVLVVARDLSVKQADAICEEVREALRRAIAIDVKAHIRFKPEESFAASATEPGAKAAELPGGPEPRLEGAV
jgi:cation diffusion facilitator family transporter